MNLLYARNLDPLTDPVGHTFEVRIRARTLLKPPIWKRAIFLGFRKAKVQRENGRLELIYALAGNERQKKFVNIADFIGLGGWLAE